MACGYTYYGSTHYGWGYLVEHGLRVDLGEVLPPVLNGLGLCGRGVGVTVGVKAGVRGQGGGVKHVRRWDAQGELLEAAGRGGAGEGSRREEATATQAGLGW